MCPACEATCSWESYFTSTLTYLGRDQLWILRAPKSRDWKEELKEEAVAREEAEVGVDKGKFLMAREDAILDLHKKLSLYPGR